MGKPKNKAKKNFAAKKRAAKKLAGVQKKSAQKKAAVGRGKASARAVQACPLAGGGIDNLAKTYAAAVASSKPWTWNDIAKGLTPGQRKKIRNHARDKNLVDVVPEDPKQDHVDPAPSAPFVIFPAKYIKDTQMLPKKNWLDTDASQFKQLNEDLAKRDPNYNPKTQTFKGSPKKYTWHHVQAPPGKMQLVEFGIHNATNHSGGRNVWGGGTDSR